MTGFLIIALILIVVIGIYLLSYILNNNTLPPEGVEIDASCESCGSAGCSLHANPNPNPNNDFKIKTE